MLLIHWLGYLTNGLGHSRGPTSQVHLAKLFLGRQFPAQRTSSFGSHRHCRRSRLARDPWVAEVLEDRTLLTAPIFINEIHYDNSGTDTAEAVEIAGPAGTDLSGWSLVRYNGNTGGVYTSPAASPIGSDLLSGAIPDQGSGFGTVVVNFASNGLQNGSPDGVALVDEFGAVRQFLSYEGSFLATNGPASGQTSIDIGVSENLNTPLGQSLQLAGRGIVYEDFTWTAPAANTFNAFNNSQTFDAPILVTTTLDEDNGSIDPAAGGGTGTSLREAIRFANDRAGADVINLSAGTYTLSIAGMDEDAAATGDLDITDTDGSLTIIGAGSGVTFIDANNLDRIFEICGCVSVQISGVTLIRGNAGGTADGGAIHNSSTLTLTDVLVDASQANRGGGIYNNGTLTIANGGVGLGNRSLGTLRVDLGGNQSTLAGNINDSVVTLNVDDPTQFPTSTPFTIRIGSEEMTVTGISGNEFQVTREVNGTTAATHSDGDTVIGLGIGIGNAATSDGGGLHNEMGLIQIASSTIDSNTASVGAGIYNYFDNGLGEVWLENTTISGNSAELAGGGIYNYDGVIDALNTTVTDNQAGSAFYPGTGGGIKNDASGGNDPAVRLRNSIVADNQVVGPGGLVGPDLAGDFDSLGHNFIGDASDSTGFVGGQNDDQVGGNSLPIKDPMLRRVGYDSLPIELTDEDLDQVESNNFIFKVIYLPEPDSPVIDSGDNNVPFSFDQRGKARRVDGDRDGTATVDIGAVEYQPPIAFDDSYGMAKDGTLIIGLDDGVRNNDDNGDENQLTVQIVTGPGQAQSFTLNPSDGSFSYEPNVGFVGVDTFAYILLNATAGASSNVATVSINVYPNSVENLLTDATAEILDALNMNERGDLDAQKAQIPDSESLNLSDSTTIAINNALLSNFDEPTRRAVAEALAGNDPQLSVDGLLNNVFWIWADPVDFIVTDPQGRRFGYTSGGGQTGGGSNVVYTGDGVVELLIIMGADVGGYNVELSGVGSFRGGMSLITSAGVTTQTFQGSLVSGSALSIALDPTATAAVVFPLFTLGNQAAGPAVNGGLLAQDNDVIFGLLDDDSSALALLGLDAENESEEFELWAIMRRWYEALMVYRRTTIESVQEALDMPDGVGFDWLEDADEDCRNALCDLLWSRFGWGILGELMGFGETVGDFLREAAGSNNDSSNEQSEAERDQPAADSENARAQPAGVDVDRNQQNKGQSSQDQAGDRPHKAATQLSPARRSTYAEEIGRPGRKP